MTALTGSPQRTLERTVGRRWLAVVLWSAMSILTVVGDAILVTHRMRSPSTVWDIGPAVTLNGVAFSTVGLLVAIRRRENPIGWLFLAAGVLSGVQLVTGEFAMYDRYVLHDREFHAPLWGWVNGLASVALLGVLPFVLLLFPDGRFLSRGWRRFAPVSLVLSLASLLWLAVLPGELGLTPGMDNPFGIHSDDALIRAVVGAPFELGVGAPLLFCVLVGVASLLLRWRGSGIEQRAQLKWVLAAAAASLGAILMSAFLIPILGYWLNTAVWNVALSIIPVAVGISILRYRLFAIDRLSRSVSYALVTGMLLAVYAGLVTAVSRLTPTGHSLAVAMSTLAVAALFQPLRTRVQAVVDRRFNRPRYDAARTIETFSLELRDQVDLEALADDLLAVVHETMQPAKVGLWLRNAEGVAR